MEADLVAALHPAIREVLDAQAGDDGSDWCATFEHPEGEALWVQVTGQHVNAHFPASEAPEAVLPRLGVSIPAGLELIGWEAEKYVTFAFSDLGSRDLARWIGQYFIRVLQLPDDRVDVTLQDLKGQGEQPEVDFFDLRLRARLEETRPGGDQLIHLWNEADGRPVSLQVELHGPWVEDLVEGSIQVFWGEVSYRSNGPESDRLIGILARQYGLPDLAGPMASEVRFKAVSLEGNPSYVDHELVRLKLFFESEDEARYAEVYTNFDLDHGVAEIAEKDIDYRKPLLRALTAAV